MLEFAANNCEFVTVRASKPSAVVCAEAPEVEITRTIRDGELAPYLPSSSQPVASTSSAPLAPPSLSTTSDVATGSSILQDSSSSDSKVKKAALAIGANLGDRFANIELALRILEARGVHYNRLPADAYVHIVDTSFLYETEAMYVSNQPKFINCACIVRRLFLYCYLSSHIVTG